MKRIPNVVAVLCSVLFLAAACPGENSGEAPPPTAVPSIVDPGVIEKIEEDGTARVMVVLRGLGTPLEPLEVVREHTAEVQASVLAILEPGDFEIYRQYVISPALAGMVTAAGLEKLSTHPDVIGIDLLGGGELH